MKNKTSIKLMAATVLASTLLLGACGNKKENTASDNSSKTTQASSSSKTNSSNKESKTQASTSTTTSEKAKASSEQASSPTTQGQEANRAAQTPQAPQQQETPAQSNQQGTQAKSNQSTYDPTTDRKLQDKQAEYNKRYKGVLTMVDKDFSAAAGNWKGANGETITVSSNGQFTVESAEGKKENYSIQSYSYTLDDGKYNAEVGGGKVIQITTGADGTVSSVVLIQP
jgi:putative lipoprotein